VHCRRFRRSFSRGPPRLTARGRHDEMDWCTRTVTCALASGVSATSPSIPAVLRPVLRCVTCRTLTSVLAPPPPP
jgi:hypothetical protein